MNRTIAHVAIIGAGISGSWLAYRLAQRGLETVLITCTDTDTPAVSLGAASVMHRALLDSVDSPKLEQVLADETTTRHPGWEPVLRKYLRREFDELAGLVPFQTLETMLIPEHPVPFPRLGAGAEVLAELHSRIRDLGGRILTGRVTGLLVEDGACQGFSWTGPHGPAVLDTGVVVIASGGYSGLLPNSPTSNAGVLLGLYATAGGELTNLEYSQRHALGDRTAGRVLYPPDLAGAQFYRNGTRATWLENAYAALPEQRRDLEIFQQYWRSNSHVPHTLRRGDENYALGPIYGLSMGGIAHTDGAGSIAGVYTTGEARHDIAADAIIGRPWATYIASSGMLADTLADLPARTPESTDATAARTDIEAGFIADIKQRLAAFEDLRYSEESATAFADWCRSNRSERGADDAGHRALLVLAEAYARSTILRRESRGYFFRPDHPTANPDLSHRRTVVRYLAGEDIVEVELTRAPTEVRAAAPFQRPQLDPGVPGVPNPGP